MRSRLILSVLPAILGLSFSPSFIGAASSQNDDLATAPRISQHEFKQALAARTIVVLDVRDATSYANGHIPGAVSVPLDELSRHVSELKAEKRPIVTYCA